MNHTPVHEYDPARKLFHGSVPLLMGTKLDAIWMGAGQALSLSVWEAMYAEAERLDALLDRFNPSSEVSRLNAAADYGEVMADPAVLSLIRIGEQYRVRTGGLFDITRGTCGEGLEIAQDGRFSLQGGSLDFGGFAKGYFLRQCKGMLQEAGIETAYIDFGGSSILTLGRHPFGDCWRIRVAHPYTGAVLRDIDLVDRSLSTSGNRPGYNGHILDPRTGHAVTLRRIVTAVSPDPLDAEVLSTAAMIADEAELAILRNNFQLSEIHVFDV